MKKVKGKVSISRTTHSLTGDYMSIELTDSNSGLSIARAEMSLQAFAEALTGIMRTEAQSIQVFNNHELLGKQRILKTVQVYLGQKVPYGSEERFELLKEHSKKHECDGWKLYEHDFNSRQLNHQTGHYHASFIKYVEVDG